MRSEIAAGDAEEEGQEEASGSGGRCIALWRRHPAGDADGAEGAGAAGGKAALLHAHRPLGCLSVCLWVLRTARVGWEGATTIGMELCS